MKILDGKGIVVTGGTGSLGQTLVRRLLSGEMGEPKKITVFSRDEAKQHRMRLDLAKKHFVTDEIIYNNSKQKLDFHIGDIRDFHSVAAVLNDADMVFNAAALKQVPNCEYFPFEAVQTNILGPENIVRAIQQHKLNIELVVGISTDKACKPINVMGMTKALQERVFIQANLRCPHTCFVCVRYGNVLTSRGSVVPLFRHQIQNGGPVTITSSQMTRFLLSLDDAVDTVFAAVKEALPGETYVAKVPSARVENIARALIGDAPIQIKSIGLRPGEKMHEILISEEEAFRTVDRGAYYAILPMLPEFRRELIGWPKCRTTEYSSAENNLSLDATIQLLKDKGGDEEVM
jgi:FlaA1/EpsC-like NDP-sugar epimerase